MGKGASLNECANDWLGTWRRKEGFVLYNYHCQIKLQTRSDSVLITTDSSHETTIILHNITIVSWLEPTVIKTFISCLLH